MKRLLILIFSVFTVSSGWTQITTVGSDATLDVATWNVEWFGDSTYGPVDDARQVRNVAAILEGSGVDIWAFQEIVDLTRAQELLTQVSGYWEGIVATNSGDQKLALVWDTRTISIIESGHILEDATYEFAGRPPLQARFQVDLPGGSFQITLINVHMKAFADQTSWQRRTAAAALIKEHIDDSNLSEEPVLFLGDFNDELHASTWNAAVSPYASFTADADHYDVLTWALDVNNVPTHLGGSTIDHMISTDELGEWLLAGSVATLDHLLTVDSFAETTSDHLPVMASFVPAGGTSIAAPERPETFAIEALYPNPVRNHVTIELGMRSHPFRVQLVDVLGRVQEDMLLDSGRHVLDVEGAPGLWWMVVRTGQQTDVRPFIVLGSSR